MPEGDSVFRLATRLRQALDGRVLAAGSLRHTTADLAGRTVLGHDSRGKLGPRSRYRRTAKAACRPCDGDC